ncbi:MAG: T9SS type A sorting domain-containing protein [Ignavibacterium sp.]
MKMKLIFIALLGFAALTYSQSFLTITKGASLTVSTGADICADSILGTIQGGGTICGSPNSVEIDNSKPLPKEFALEQNYPNPFNPTTKISWQSPVSGNQTLKIYDILGNEVATIVNQFLEAGSYYTEFNASELTSGIYIYRLQVGDRVFTKKMTLMK